MNNDLYESLICEDATSPDRFNDVYTHLKLLDDKLHKLKKKKKKAGKGKKRKLKKRIKYLELEHAQMRQFMIYMAYQMKTSFKPQQGSRWSETICSSLPKALELVTATINRLPAKNQPQLCLPDGRDKK